MNSVKHSRASVITIRLQDVGDVTELIIADDGIGIPNPEPNDGAGLGIMRYRAASIGASLSVGRSAAGGTVVTCAVRQPSTSRKTPA